MSCCDFRIDNFSCLFFSIFDDWKIKLNKFVICVYFLDKNCEVIIYDWLVLVGKFGIDVFMFGYSNCYKYSWINYDNLIECMIILFFLVGFWFYLFIWGFCGWN